MPSKPLRTTSVLVGKGYAAAGQAGACLHTMAVLQAHQADLLKELDEGEELIEMSFSPRSEQGTYVLASWSNLTPRTDTWFSVLEKAHFSWRLILTPALSCGRERHLNVESPTAPIDLESTNHRYSSVCRCPGVTEEPEQRPHTS